MYWAESLYVLGRELMCSGQRAHVVGGELMKIVDSELGKQQAGCSWYGTY
jgi:hypothetical protein